MMALLIAVIAALIVADVSYRVWFLVARDHHLD